MNFIRFIISWTIFFGCSLDGGIALNRTVRQTSCSAEQFLCKRGGRCISLSDVCNGIGQCGDNSDEDPSICKCGTGTEAGSLRNKRPGVHEAPLGAQPWFVGIYQVRPNSSQYSLIASGTLIYDDIVITCGTCVTNPDTSLPYSTNLIRISVGKLKRDYNSDESIQQKIEVRKIVKRTNNEEERKRNLAVIKLKKPVIKSEYVGPACLWTLKELPTGARRGTIAGWGLQSSGNPGVNLLESLVSIIDDEDCSRINPVNRRLLNNYKFCVTFDQGVGIKGDKGGGPIIILHNGRYYLVGVFSNHQPDPHFGIATKISKHIDWIKRTVYDLKETDRLCSQNNRFYCKSGSRCIRKELVCNQRVDCDDGSDEDPSHCTVKPSTNKPSTNKPSTNKPSTNKPSTNKPRTIKPVTIKPSTNKPSTNKPSTNKPSTNKPRTIKPGTIKPSTNKPRTSKPSTNKPSTNKPSKNKPSTVKQPASNSNDLSCEIPEGSEIFRAKKCGDLSYCKSKFFAPTNSRYDITCPTGRGFAKPGVSKMSVACLDGEWIPDLQDSKCLKLCSPQKYKSLDLNCQYQGSRVDCNKMIRPGTEIKVQCKRNYKKQLLVNYAKQTTCRKDGTLEHDISAECIPVCGVPYDNKAQILLSNGNKTVYAKYPWHTGLYWRAELQDGGIEYRYQCGGTLIDTNKVLTAGHCIWESDKNVMNPKDIVVTFGKYYSTWNRQEDLEQRHHVSKIIPGRHYNGATTKYSQDIAVVILTKDVQLSDYIMPACLDLYSLSGGIPKNQLGHIVGWGRLSESGEQPTTELLEAYLKYLDLDSCRIKYAKYDFNDYLQPDKFCVEYKDGAGTQMGDSGGGFTFTHDSLHYVYGVVSIKKGGQDEFAAFTNISSHASWLSDILKNN